MTSAPLSVQIGSRTALTRRHGSCRKAALALIAVDGGGTGHRLRRGAVGEVFGEGPRAAVAGDRGPDDTRPLGAERLQRDAPVPHHVRGEVVGDDIEAGQHLPEDAAPRMGHVQRERVPPVGAGGSLSGNQHIALNPAGPVVVAVTSPSADGNYQTGETILVEVRYDQAVSVLGGPELMLETGTVDRIAAFTPDRRDPATLTFAYLVLEGDASPDLTYVGVDAFNANGASITGSASGAQASRWYWCGVLGELYGGSIETRFGRDLPEVLSWIRDGGPEPGAIYDAEFAPARLLTLRTRNSAAYKGVYALLLREGARDCDLPPIVVPLAR